MDDNQKKFLSALCELSDGNTLKMVNIKQIVEKIDIESEQISLVLTELKQNGMLEHAVMGDMVAISHEGVRAARR